MILSYAEFNLIPGFRFLEGMRVFSEAGWARVITVPENPSWSCVDLRDPATLGCLLELVRQAWGNPGITSRRTHTINPIWCVDAGPEYSMEPPTIFSGASEAIALVAALMAAPRR